MKTRREFLATAIAAVVLLTKSSALSAAQSGLSTADETRRKDSVSNNRVPGGQYMTDKGEDPRITRARLSGPEQVTKDATVAEMAADGTITVLVKGTNEWFAHRETKTKSAPHRCA